MSDYFLADDLSGALDAAAAFHRVGRSVEVVLSAEEWPDGSTADVIGITTETRNASPATAVERVKAAMEKGRERGSRLVYKKIDSTLRGPVAAELMSVAAAMPEARILFAPANPRVGRIVRGGQLLVHGVPLAQTEFARDPISPVRESSISRLLGEAANLRVIIPDVETDADLAKAVREMQKDERPWVAIGSGALAHPVAELHRDTTGAARPSIPSPVRGTTLFVCGSAHDASRAQAQELARRYGVPICEVRPEDVDRVTRQAIAEVTRHGAVSILVAPERIESARALQAITQVAQTVAAETKPKAIFATGGDTAFALCRALRVSSLTFHAEIEAGVSLARANSLLGPICWVVKPGGFGNAGTWTRVFEQLRPSYFI